MDFYYADTSNQPVGPVTKDQLHSLYREGTIGLETQVIPEGSDDWHQYRKIAVPMPPIAGRARPRQDRVARTHRGNSPERLQPGGSHGDMPVLRRTHRGGGKKVQALRRKRST